MVTVNDLRRRSQYVSEISFGFKGEIYDARFFPTINTTFLQKHAVNMDVGSREIARHTSVYVGRVIASFEKSDVSFKRRIRID